MTNCENIVVASLRGVFITELMSSNASWFLLGFILKQTYTYYRCSKVRVDPLWLRLLVLGSVATQLIDTVACAYPAYGFGVQRWGHPAILSEFSPASVIIGNLTLLTLAAAISFTQGFYVWRIWIFSGSGAVERNRLKIAARVTAAFVLFLSICAAACYLSIFVAASFASATPRWFLPLELVANASTATADILITVLMTMLLSQARAQTCFSRTRSALSQISAITLQSGLLTTFLTICALSLDVAQNDVFGIIWELSTKSYAISLFANLNARSQFRRNVQHISIEHGHWQEDDGSYRAVTPISVRFAEAATGQGGEIRSERVDSGQV